jgi:predicted  nucleic acid-binding Zn-ribbon protein
MARPAQILYRLQLLDAELAEQMSKLREAEALCGETRELHAAQLAHQKATEECGDWRARMRELEIDMSAVNARIAATEGRLYGGQVTNPKELAGLQLDLQSSKRTRAQLEDQLLEAMVHLEDCEGIVGRTAAELEEVRVNWQRNQEHVAEQIERLQSQVADLKQTRASLAASVGPSQLAIYEDLRPKKAGRAVALLEGQMCQGCRVTVPANKAQLVRKSLDLVTCTNCGRILTSES